MLIGINDDTINNKRQCYYDVTFDNKPQDILLVLLANYYMATMAAAM